MQNGDQDVQQLSHKPRVALRGVGWAHCSVLEGGSYMLFTELLTSFRRPSDGITGFVVYLTLSSKNFRHLAGVPREPPSFP